MARRPIQREFYDNLLKAFRDAPGNGAHAARKAGCDQRTAKRAWEKGWSPGIPWARPIKHLIEEEREEARAAQRRLEERKDAEAAEERGKAREDAVQSLVQEGQMIRLGRSNALGALASIAQMLPAMRVVGEKMRDKILAGEEIDLKMGMRLHRDFGMTVRNLATAAQILVESERQHKGEPSAVIGVQMDGEITVDEALREMAEVSELYELAKRRGLIGPVLDVVQVTDKGSTNGTNGTNGANGNGVH